MDSQSPLNGDDLLEAYVSPPAVDVRGIDAAKRPEPSLTETLAILDLFTTDQCEMAGSYIASAAGTGGNTDGILTSLCKHGLLNRHPRDIYTIGFRSLELCAAYEQAMPLVECSRAILLSIRDQLDETVLLAIRLGDFRVNIAQVPARQFFHQTIILGKRKPLHKGAPGKVLLSGLPAASFDRYLTWLFPDPADTVSNMRRRALRDAAARIDETGFAESIAEGFGSGASFAVPVRDSQARIMATLAVSVPLCRYTRSLRDNAFQLLVNAAAGLTERYRDRLAAPQQVWAAPASASHTEGVGSLFRRLTE